MRIWSDTIARHELQRGHADAQIADTTLFIEHTTHRARRRTHRSDVYLTGDGPRHTRRVNSGTSSHRSRDYAATWMDWGWFIAVLFRFDPNAVIGQYEGRHSFLLQTAAAWKYRVEHDRSCKDWATHVAAGMTPGYRIIGGTPFADLSHLPVTRLPNMGDLDQVDAWLEGRATS